MYPETIPLITIPLRKVGTVIAVVYIAFSSPAPTKAAIADYLTNPKTFERIVIIINIIVVRP